MISFVRWCNKRKKDRKKEIETNYSECQTIYEKRRQKIL
jgi:hypothetical protein